MDFKPVYVNATTLDDCWFQLLSKLYDNGRKYLISEGSYKGAYRLAFDDVAGFIKYPHQRPLAPIVPEGIPAPTNDEDIEKYFIEYLMDGNIKDNEDYKYGTFINGGEYEIPRGIYCKHKDMAKFNLNYAWDEPPKVIVPNQLEWIINHFKEKGFGNEHCYLTVGYPESNFAYDIKYANEQERKTSPCLRGLDFRIIEDIEYFCPDCGEVWKFNETLTTNDKNILCPNDRSILHRPEQIDRKNYLLTKVIYRSWDLYGGFPVNMGGFTLLNEYIANELGIVPGPLSFTCKSLHCYDFQLEVLKHRLGK